MTRALCLNADLGELPGAEGRALDAAMLRVVTRCNVACGGHAGDDASMRATLRAARERGVRIGAHPSYPDVENFGRRTLTLPPDDLIASLTAQTRALIRIAAEEDAAVTHLKAHGALYNDAAKDIRLAELIAGVAAEAGIGELIGPPDSALERAAKTAGLVFVAEGFADRSYERDGSLTQRSQAGAVLEDTAAVLAQALSFALDQRVSVRGGGSISLAISTLCLHSDTPGAPAHAQALRAGLEAAGIEVRA